MDPELSQFIYWAVLCATFAFAVTAVLAVAPKGIDLFTVVVMGIITANGGGTIRDLILGVPMFWQDELSYIWVAIAGSIVAFAAASLFRGHIVNSVLLYLDGFGAALFGVLATQKVWAVGYGLWPASCSHYSRRRNSHRWRVTQGCLGRPAEFVDDQGTLRHSGLSGMHRLRATFKIFPRPRNVAHVYLFRDIFQP